MTRRRRAREWPSNPKVLITGTVTEVIADSLGPTAALAGAALLLAILVSVTSATLTSGRGAVATVTTQIIELLAISVPSGWLGLLRLAASAVRLPSCPSSGARGFASRVLPAITLAIPMTGVLTQVLRERFDEALGQPFITTVRTRGATEVRVRLVHALRHAVIPALTFSGAILGSLLVGTAVVETLFARPGLGRTLLTAVLGNDVPLVMGIVIFGSLVFVVVNSLVDVLATGIDPRSKLKTRGGSGW